MEHARAAGDAAVPLPLAARPTTTTYARAVRRADRRGQRAGSPRSARPPLETRAAAAGPRRAPQATQQPRRRPTRERSLADGGARTAASSRSTPTCVLDSGSSRSRERFPERFIECGIAEQDMVSQAGGMALDGHAAGRPLVRLLPVDPRRTSRSTTTPPSARRSSTSARSPGSFPAGPATRISRCATSRRFAAVPGLEMLEPSCEDEVVQAVEYASTRSAASCYLRLVSVPWRVPFALPPDYRLERGRGVR